MRRGKKDQSARPAARANERLAPPLPQTSVEDIFHRDSFPTLDGVVMSLKVDAQASAPRPSKRASEQANRAVSQSVSQSVGLPPSLPPVGPRSFSPRRNIRTTYVRAHEQAT